MGGSPGGPGSVCGILGPSGGGPVPVWGVPGPVWGGSWARLGSPGGVLGPSWEGPGPVLGVLVGGPGGLLEPSGGLLAASWRKCRKCMKNQYKLTIFGFPAAYGSRLGGLSGRLGASRGTPGGVLEASRGLLACHVWRLPKLGTHPKGDFGAPPPPSTRRPGTTGNDQPGMGGPRDGW